MAEMIYSQYPRSASLECQFDAFVRNVLDCCSNHGSSGVSEECGGWVVCKPKPIMHNQISGMCKILAINSFICHGEL